MKAIKISNYSNNSMINNLKHKVQVIFPLLYIPIVNLLFQIINYFQPLWTAT